MWYATIQAMLGKLYVLSLYFTLYAHFPFGARLRAPAIVLSLTTLATETTA